MGTGAKRRESTRRVAPRGVERSEIKSPAVTGDTECKTSSTNCASMSEVGSTTINSVAPTRSLRDSQVGSEDGSGCITGNPRKRLRPRGGMETTAHAPPESHRLGHRPERSAQSVAES